MALFKPATDPTPNPGDLSPETVSADVVQPEESLRRRDRATIASLSGAHFVNDTYANFLGPLLPLIVGKLSLTIAQAGWLGAVLTVSSCFMQPVYGYLSDRYLVRFFAVFSPLITTVFMSFIGIAPNFTVLALLLAAAGVGIASFHPQGAALIGAASRDRSGLGMSIFIGSGTLGFALAPIIAPYTVELFSLERSYFIMIPGVLAFAVLYFLIPHDPPQPVATQSRADLKDLLLPMWRPLLILYLLVVIRSAVQIGFVHFLPLYFFQQGNDLVASGRLASLFTLFGAMGGFAGGSALRQGGRPQGDRLFHAAGPAVSGRLLSHRGRGLVRLPGLGSRPAALHPACQRGDGPEDAAATDQHRLVPDDGVRLGNGRTGHPGGGRAGRPDRSGLGPAAGGRPGGVRLPALPVPAQGLRTGRWNRTDRVSLEPVTSQATDTTGGTGRFLKAPAIC